MQHDQPGIKARSLVLAALTTLSLLAVDAHSAPGPGDIPPPDLGVTSDGKPITLNDHAGQAVVISFWATWCPYCIKELPILERLQNVAGPRHLHVIAVNTEDYETFHRVARLMKSFQLELGRDFDGKAQAAYGVRGLPHMVIIGRDGRILKVHHGYNESSLDGIVADVNRAMGATPRPPEVKPEADQRDGSVK
jgi:thiol-disulfide isomerase/thioredoxin